MTDEQLGVADAAAAPAVGRAPSPLTVPAIALLALLLGVVTFSSLRGQTTSSTLPRSTGGIAGSSSLPQAPVLPTPPVVAPAPQPVFVPRPAAPIVVQQPNRAPLPAPEAAPISTTSALIVDLTRGAEAGAAGAAAAGAVVAGAGDKLAGNDAFADRITRTPPDTVFASKLTSQDLVIPQGTVISGVLETAINSDLPGLVRAVVSRDVRGFDGARILIPRGSRLIGQYSSGVALGQSRAFVIWTRMLRADGVSIQLGSPTTDPLGTAGLAGKVNSHFLRRFGAATFLSVLNGAIDYLSRGNGNNQTLVVGSSTSATQLATLALQKQIDIPPTIKVAQGTPVLVFVARDLDFSNRGP